MTPSEYMGLSELMDFTSAWIEGHLYHVHGVFRFLFEFLLDNRNLPEKMLQPLQDFSKEELKATLQALRRQSNNSQFSGQKDISFDEKFSL